VSGLVLNNGVLLLFRYIGKVDVHRDIVLRFVLGGGGTLHPDMVGEPAGMLVNTWVHMAWERLVI